MLFFTPSIIDPGFTLSHGGVWDVFSLCFVLLVIFISSWYYLRKSSPGHGKANNERKGPREKEFSRPAVRYRTWRVRGIPLSFDQTTLADVFQTHPKLGLSDDHDNRAAVQTLAPAHGHDQVATVRFRRTPRQLELLKKGCQLSLNLEKPERQEAGSERMSSLYSSRTSITIDDHFGGITVLHSPPPERHDFDILAVSGLGSHAFGSFVNKEDGYIWLTDSLIEDIPAARVMIYGYDSTVQNSSSVAELGDLADQLWRAMRRILKPTPRRHIVLVGHSLGGLLIKEALIRFSESNDEPDIIGSVKGSLFFGVPNDGMKIGSLIPMVGDRPNMPLIQSLRGENSQVLRTLGENFAKVTTQAQLDIFCFYETLLSPTAIEVNGRYKMEGPREFLVNQSSATSCLPRDLRGDRGLPLTFMASGGESPAVVF